MIAIQRGTGKQTDQPEFFPIGGAALNWFLRLPIKKTWYSLTQTRPLWKTLGYILSKDVMHNSIEEKTQVFLLKNLANPDFWLTVTAIKNIPAFQKLRCSKWKTQVFS